MLSRLQSKPHQEGTHRYVSNKICRSTLLSLLLIALQVDLPVLPLGRRTSIVLITQFSQCTAIVFISLVDQSLKPNALHVNEVMNWLMNQQTCLGSNCRNAPASFLKGCDLLTNMAHYNAFSISCFVLHSTFWLVRLDSRKGDNNDSAREHNSRTLKLNIQPVVETGFRSFKIFIPHCENMLQVKILHWKCRNVSPVAARWRSR